MNSRRNAQPRQAAGGASPGRRRPPALLLTVALLLAAAAAPAGAQVAAPAAPAGAVSAAASAQPPGLAPESLPELLQRVLPSDPQVRSARFQLEISAERRIQARSRLLPTVGVQATQGRSVEQEFGLPIDRRTQRSEASLRWNLYNSGNDAAELRATTLEEAASEQDLRRAQEDSAQRVGEAYLEVLRLQSVLPRAAERLQAVQRLVEQTRRQADLGKVSDADAQQAEAALLDAEMAHEEVVADHDSARRKLARLIGAASVDELRPAVAVVLPPPAAGERTDRYSDTPPGVLLAAQRRAVAARARVRPQVSLLAPRIDLEVRNQLGDATTPALTSQTSRSWQVTARWDFPVGGETQARRNETERRAEAAEAEAERVSRNLQAELTTLGPQLAQAERALAMIVRQIEQYGNLVRAGELQFEAGRRTLAQLIALRESRYNAERRLAEQATRLQKARLSQLYYSGELLQAMGVAPLPRVEPLAPPPSTPPPSVDDMAPGG
jgi:outer membrane protein TolC